MATDFSDRSDRALLRAKMICRETGAALVLTHIIDDQPERRLARTVASANAVLLKMADNYQNDDILAEPMVKVGDAADGMLQAADETDAELIIIGPYLNRALGAVGGTVGRVVSASQRPVLVVAAPPSGSYRRGLLALDFDKASTAAARAAVGLGVFNHLSMTVMHAINPTRTGRLMAETEEDEQKRVKASLRELLCDAGLEASTQIVARVGTPTDAILDSAREQGADLVILGTNKRKGVARLLVASVAAEVSRRPAGHAPRARRLIIARFADVSFIQSGAKSAVQL